MIDLEKEKAKCPLCGKTGKTKDGYRVRCDRPHNGQHVLPIPPICLFGEDKYSDIAVTIPHYPALPGHLPYIDCFATPGDIYDTYGSFYGFMPGA